MYASGVVATEGHDHGVGARNHQGWHGLDNIAWNIRQTYVPKAVSEGSPWA
jgi:hypothetical protein